MRTRRVGTWLRSVVGGLQSSTRRVWWTSFVLVALLSGLWSLANPLYAAPDEPAHVVRAVALAHGQVIGRTPSQAEARRLDLTDRKDYVVVRVPVVYRDASESACFPGHRSITAACLRFDGPTRNTDEGTYVGRHPPAYYALVGAVSLITPPGSVAVRLMRLIGALMTGALVATAITALRWTAAPRLLGIGLAIAITPMVLFVSSAVNPSAPEVAASLAVWLCGLLLVWRARERVDARLVTAVGIAGCVLALSRQLGPLWLALMGLTMLGVSSRTALRNLARSGWARLWAGLVVASSLVQVGWDVIAKPLEVKRSGNAPSNIELSEILRTTIGRTFPRYREMIGSFGWLDAPSPALTWVPWTVLIGLLVLGAVVWSSRRHIAVLLGLVAATIFVPVAIESATFTDAGTLTWQGRYTLPLAVGIPILAAAVLSMTGRGRQLTTPRLVLAVGAVLSGAQIIAFAQNLRRYMVGYNGDLAFWVRPEWSPPLPALLLLAAFAAVAVAFAWWLLAVVPRGSGAADGVPLDVDSETPPRERAIATVSPKG